MTNSAENTQRLMHLFGRMRDVPAGPALQQLKELNLSPSHFRALHLLAPDRMLAMKDLAEQLQLTPPSVTALTRRLVQTGLVRRQEHPEDSRVVLLALTDEGRVLQEELIAEHQERMERMLGGLTPEEQVVFLDLMERAIMALHSSSGDEAPASGDKPIDG